MLQADVSDISSTGGGMLQADVSDTSSTGGGGHAAG